MLPGVVIMVLSAIWIAQGNPIAMLHPAATDAASVMSMAGGHPHPRYFPAITGLGDVAFLAGIILLFAGVEVHAVHANEMTDPKRQFPMAMLIASVAVILLFTLGSFAVATVLPDKDINLQEGLMKAFQQIFSRLGIDWATPIVCLLLAFGGIGGVMSWISGPSRGLLWTAQEGEIPPFLAKTNKNGVQINILIVQGVIVTVLALAYFVMTNVSVAFFLLSAVTITLYLIMYMLMYAAAIRLRHSRPDLKRSYRVPGGIVGMWVRFRRRIRRRLLRVPGRILSAITTSGRQPGAVCRPGGLRHRGVHGFAAADRHGETGILALRQRRCDSGRESRIAIRLP